MPYKDPAQRKTYAHAWYLAHAEKQKARARRQRLKDPAAALARQRKHYGIDPAAAVELLLHATVCEGCGKRDKLVPDHDHKTGVLRGALCGSCNLGLGLLKDSPTILVSLLHYLQRDRT